MQLKARLIDDLLDITRIASGKLFRRARSCDVQELAEEAVRMVANDVKAKNIHLTFDAQAGRRRGFGDPVRITQVFWNLLKNAVKFTPRGGSISLRMREEGDMFRFDVDNTGIGFSADDGERMFAPFEQVSAREECRH